jgi:hypothetical protein
MVPPKYQSGRALTRKPVAVSSAQNDCSALPSASRAPAYGCPWTAWPYWRQRHIRLGDGFQAPCSHVSSKGFACIAAAIWCDGIPVMQLIWLQHCAMREATQSHCSGRLHGGALWVEVPAPVVVRRLLHYRLEMAGADGWVGVVLGVGGHWRASHSPHQSESSVPGQTAKCSVSSMST